MNKRPAFYECGICGHWHSVEWNGDCREDGARFTEEQIEAKHGAYGEGWREVPMPGCEKCVSEL